MGLEPRRAVRIWARTISLETACNKAVSREAVCSSFSHSTSLPAVDQHTELIPMKRNLP
jgi:hypothetical protein